MRCFQVKEDYVLSSGACCSMLPLPTHPAKPNCSQNDSVWLTRVTVITVQGDRFPLCRKLWVKVQLTFKTHQHRQCYSEVKCKTNLWMGQLIISILMNKRCAHSLFFHFQVLINRLVIINWNSTFIEKWQFINIKLCYYRTYLLDFHEYINSAITSGTVCWNVRAG